LRGKQLVKGVQLFRRQEIPFTLSLFTLDLPTPIASFN